MRSLERSRSRGIDQAHIADDRKNIENRKHNSKTTWDDIALSKDYIAQMKRLIDSLPVIDDAAEGKKDQRSEGMKNQFNSVIESNDVFNIDQESHKQEAIKEARDRVLDSFRKTESPTKLHDIDQPKNLEIHEPSPPGNQNLNEEASIDIPEEKNETPINEIPKVEEKIEETVVENATRPIDTGNYEEEKTKESQITEKTPAGQSIEEEKVGISENNIEVKRQPNGVDSDVSRVLFGTPTNIKNMLGDQQFSKWQDIVNQDVDNGKYANAKYEDGLVYYIGNVNENSVDDRGDDWDSMKYLSRDERLKYDEQVKGIDPKVWKQINKTVYALGATLGDNSKEYHDALNKINQDIYNGRYRTAEYAVVRNEGEEFEEGVVIFNEVANNDMREEPVHESKNAEPENEAIPDAKLEEPEFAPKPEEEPFKGEMTEIIKFEGRMYLDTLKKIYARLDNADAEQRGRFKYLYENLSATSKMKPLNKDEEQKKLDRIYAYGDLIDRLYNELGGD